MKAGDDKMDAEIKASLDKLLKEIADWKAEKKDS